MDLPTSDLLGRLLRRLARHPVLVAGAATIGVSVGRDAFRLRAGEIDRSEFLLRTGEHVGSVSGGAFGAALGGLAGSVVPIFGSLVGGFAGGLLGEAGGSKLGKGLVAAVQRLGRNKSQGRDPSLDPPHRVL